MLVREGDCDGRLRDCDGFETDEDGDLVKDPSCDCE